MRLGYRVRPGPSAKVTTGVRAARLIGDAKRLRPSASEVEQPSTRAPRDDDLVARRKAELLAVTAGTNRGANAGIEKRAEVEEAQTALESVGGDIDLDTSLEGKWRLLYTTSLDLLPLFWVENLTQLNSVGPIYQSFERPNVSGVGKVQNIISASLPPFLDSVTLTVSASYEVVSKRRIALNFEEAEVSDFVLSDLGKTVVSPAVLPRGQATMRVLQLIQDFTASAPLRSPFGSDVRRAVGNPTLLITHLTDSILVGRAIPGGGVYILEREEEDL